MSATATARTRLRALLPALQRRRAAVEMTLVRFTGALPVHAVRVATLRLLGAHIHPEAVVYHGVQVRGVGHLTVGARTQVGDHCVLDARGGLELGADVNLSTGVQVWTAQHAWDSPDFAYEVNPVRIGDRAWLGPRVTVLPGTVVGEGVVLAAGAVARGTLEPYGLYGGVPARRLADRRRDLDYRLSGPRGKTWWW